MISLSAPGRDKEGPRGMPKIDIASLPIEAGSTYPKPFRPVVAGRSRKRLGVAAGLDQFGVNLTTLKPGAASALRHWHEKEDELVYIIEGEVVLIEDGGETVLRAGDCAAFPKGTGDGHHLINRGAATAVYLEAGSRHGADLTTCSDIDLKSANADGRFVHKDGTPYPDG